MKLNNKGWGTIEMLFLSGGLLVALLIAIFFISQLYGSFEAATGNKVYFDMEERLESAAREYIIDNEMNDYGEYKITLATLKNNNYIKTFVDNDNKDCNGYVLVSKTSASTLYNAYISCKNYQTTNY